MNIAHLVVMMVDSTSETWYRLVDDTSGGRAVIYRSRIHVFLAEISHMRHFGPLAPPGAHGREPGGGRCTWSQLWHSGPSPGRKEASHGPAWAMGRRESLVIAFNVAYNAVKIKSQSGMERRLVQC